MTTPNPAIPGHHTSPHRKANHQTLVADRQQQQQQQSRRLSDTIDDPMDTNGHPNHNQSPGHMRGNSSTSGTGSSRTPGSRSKILLTISDDLCYTLEISGHTMASVMASVSMDEQLKQEWHLWHRFCAEPHQFFVYVFDEDFQQYVRHRPSVPIRHLSRIKIKNKFYVNQSHRSLDSLDTEPTDALISTDMVGTTTGGVGSGGSVSAVGPAVPVVTPVVDDKSDNHRTVAAVSNHINTTLSHNHLNNYASPSAPTISTTSSYTAAINGQLTDINTSSITPTVTPIATLTAPLRNITAGAVNPSLAQSLPSKIGQTLATKAAKKLFTSPSAPVLSQQVLANGRPGRDGWDLTAEPPVGPAYDWTRDQTMAFLTACRTYASILSAKANVSEVAPAVWEQLARELNDKGLGHQFEAHQCRTHFSWLRSTYANILCYPAITLDTRWPYFNQMKLVCGDKLPTQLPPLTPVAIKRRAPPPVATTTPIRTPPSAVTPIYKSARIDAMMKARAAKASAGKSGGNKSGGNKSGSRLSSNSRNSSNSKARTKLAKAILANSAPPRLIPTPSGGSTTTSDGAGDKGRTRRPSGPLAKNSANQEVSELYVALLNLVKKYMKHFELEKKNKIWVKIEREMNAAGYKWNATSLRALFHRLRYTYLNILRSVDDEDRAADSWPYYRYFNGLDLTAFSHKRSLVAHNSSATDSDNNTAPGDGGDTTEVDGNSPTTAKRRPGRPRKYPQPPAPVLTDIGGTDTIASALDAAAAAVLVTTGPNTTQDTDSQYSSGTANGDDDMDMSGPTVAAAPEPTPQSIPLPPLLKAKAVEISAGLGGSEDDEGYAAGAGGDTRAVTAAAGSVVAAMVDTPGVVAPTLSPSRQHIIKC